MLWIRLQTQQFRDALFIGALNKSIRRLSDYKSYIQIRQPLKDRWEHDDPKWEPFNDVERAISALQWTIQHDMFRREGEMDGGTKWRDWWHRVKSSYRRLHRALFWE